MRSFTTLTNATNQIDEYQWEQRDRKDGAVVGVTILPDISFEMVQKNAAEKPL